MREPAARASGSGVDGVDEGLDRAIGVRTLAANAVNLTVGGGIFVLPAAAAAALGSAALLAYAVCGAAMCLVLLCFAEAGSRVSRSGGSYAYVEAAFGPYAGFLVGTLLWFAFGVLSDAAIATALVSTVGAAWPAVRHPVARAGSLVGLFTLLALVNVRGVRHGARFAVGITIVKLVPLLLLVAVGLTGMHGENFSWGGPVSARRMGDASLLLFFAFSGAESALTASGEIRDPARTVPRGILLAAAGVVALYIALHLVAQGVLGPQLVESREAPLASAAERVLGSGGRVLLLAGAGLSILGTLSGDMLATPRALFAQARDGILAARFARVHPRFRTPHVAIAGYAALVCAFAVTGAFEELAALASAGILLIYLAVCLAVLELRRRDVRLVTPPFRLPGGRLIPLLACGIIAWLLVHTTRAEAMGLGLGLLIASAVYRWRREKRPAVAVVPELP